MENNKEAKLGKKKFLKFTVTKTEDGTSTNLRAKGLSDFEIVGMLSYYLDSYKVKMMRGVETTDNNNI